MTGKTLLPFTDVVRWGVDQRLSAESIRQGRDNLELPHHDQPSIKNSIGNGLSPATSTPLNTTLDELFNLRVGANGGASIENKAAITDLNIVFPWYGPGYSITTSAGMGDGSNTLTEYAFLPPCVTSLGSDSFNSNPSLKGINFPDSLESIGNNAFFECTSFESPIEIPYKMTAIEQGTFRQVASITLDTGYSGSMTIGNSAFMECPNLSNVTLRGGLTFLGYSCFESCTSLTEITIPSTIEEIEYSVFSGCTALATINILSTDPPVVGVDVFSGVAATEVHVRAGSNFGATFGGLPVVADL